jgi:magnesium-protoporphyrin O-methyltransferase
VEALRAAIDALDVRNGVLLDIGGGVGVIQHELLDGRVERSVHVDASSAHIAAAQEEAERLGHASRTNFVYGDFVALAETLPAADIVTLDRVICCYHDMAALTSLSARKATWLYGAVYPRASAWVGLAIALVNAFQRIKESEFRVFHHPPASIDAALRAAGLEQQSVRRTMAWEVAVYVRRVKPVG